MGFVVSHLSGKNKDAAKAGHPGCTRRASLLLFAWRGVCEDSIEERPAPSFAQSVALTGESRGCYTGERSFLRGFQQ
jgi:hypothetical protein